MLPRDPENSVLVAVDEVARSHLEPRDLDGCADRCQAHVGARHAEPGGMDAHPERRELLHQVGTPNRVSVHAGMPHSFMLLAGVLDDGDHALTTFAHGLAELLSSG